MKSSKPPNGVWRGKYTIPHPRTLNYLPSQWPSVNSLYTLKLNPVTDAWFLVSWSVMSDSATPWTVACQAPLSMEFSREEYWSRLSFLSPGDLPDPGIEPGPPVLRADSLLFRPPGKPFTGQDIIRSMGQNGLVESIVSGVRRPGFQAHILINSYENFPYSNSGLMFTTLKIRELNLDYVSVFKPMGSLQCLSPHYIFSLLSFSSIQIPILHSSKYTKKVRLLYKLLALCCSK